MFNYFDKDKDGKISYHDFVTSIGFDIHPSESFYFRLEDPYAKCQKDRTCDEPGCWAPAVGSTVYCLSHLKQNKQKIQKLYKNIYNKIVAKDPLNWVKFIRKLKMSSVEDDTSQLKMEQFTKVLASYRLRLSDKQSSVL